MLNDVKLSIRGWITNTIWFRFNCVNLASFGSDSMGQNGDQLFPRRSFNHQSNSEQCLFRRQMYILTQEFDTENSDFFFYSKKS